MFVAEEVRRFANPERVIVLPLMPVTVRPSKVEPTTNVEGTLATVTDAEPVLLAVTLTVLP